MSYICFMSQKHYFFFPKKDMMDPAPFTFTAAVAGLLPAAAPFFGPVLLPLAGVPYCVIHKLQNKT